jgi:hypothetical protein
MLRSHRKIALMLAIALLIAGLSTIYSKIR